MLVNIEDTSLNYFQVILVLNTLVRLSSVFFQCLSSTLFDFVSVISVKTSYDVFSTCGCSEFSAPPRLHFDNVIVICTSICVNLFYLLSPFQGQRFASFKYEVCYFFFQPLIAIILLTNTLHRHTPKTFSLFPHIMEIYFFLLNLV